MSRRRAVLLVTAGVAMGVAVLSVLPGRIDEGQASRIANRLLVQYQRRHGEPPARFLPVERALWADGWEFRWRYRPCADVASLRIWIRHDGREARFVETPDCMPEPGRSRNFGAGPATI